ncbi:MAG: AraC family transcriptional regulator [Halopseudomonas sp.]
MSLITVPVAYVHSLIKSLEANPVELGELLAAAEISEQELQQPELSAAKYGKLYQKAMWLMRDESYGMPSGGKVPNGTFRMMCLCCIHCLKLGDAMQRCSDFYEICQGARIKPTLEFRGKQAVVNMGPLETVSEQEFKQIMAGYSTTSIRTALSAWHHFQCWLVGRRVKLASVSFAFARPKDAADYEVLFQAPVKFNQPNNQLRYDLSQMELPLVQTEQTLEGFLKTAPYQLLVMVDSDNSLRAEVRSLIGRDFSRPLPSAEQVAESLHMSVTTLRRRLQSETTSYQKIKDECRREAATNYLSCPELTNTDIAHLMGFDETSAFFRSFKKWTGMTPGVYRKSVL